MEKFIVKHRKIILLLAILLMVPSLIGFLNTRVNYDMLTYLPDKMETVQGQEELLQSFGKGGFSIIITEDLPKQNRPNSKKSSVKSLMLIPSLAMVLCTTIIFPLKFSQKKSTTNFKRVMSP